MIWMLLFIVAAGGGLGLLYLLILRSQQITILKKQIDHIKQQLLTEMEQQAVLKNKITELNKQREHDVLYDTLTGLPGRKVFEDRLMQAIKISERHQLLFSVMLLNLDGFKLINNALGRDVGDILLKEVALRLQTLVRQSDSISRFSGDEFAVLLLHLNKPEMAAYVAQRMLDVIAEPFIVQDQEVFVTASIGIATYPLDGDDIKVILLRANNAMHQAKARGRNKFQFYRAEMHALSQRDLALTLGLQNAEVFKEFEICYQPEINIKAKNIHSIEALIYWQHPDFGLLNPDDFLWLAENNNKILEIGEWVFGNALKQFVKWKEQNFNFHMLAVPVSPRQLENSRFAYRLGQMIQDLNVDASSLILEVSETALSSRLDFIEKMLNMLKHIGVQIAIKDFGEGLLSLQHLQRFPIDCLKISSKLVKNMTIHKDSREMIKLIGILAKNLKFSVVATGVESEKQKQLLLDLDYHLMEGKFFSLPLHAEELTIEKINTLITGRQVFTQPPFPPSS